MEILTVTTAVLLFWVCVIQGAYIWYLRGRVGDLEKSNSHNWGNSKAHEDQFVQSLVRISTIKDKVKEGMNLLQEGLNQ